MPVVCDKYPVGVMRLAMSSIAAISKKLQRIWSIGRFLLEFPKYLLLHYIKSWSPLRTVWSQNNLSSSDTVNTFETPLRQISMLSQIQWQKIPTFLDKKCPRRGFGRFPYLWEISPLRMFWQPSHLSCTFLLKTFGAITNSSDFRCQMKILLVIFLHNLELFMPGNHVQGGKDKCFVKTTFLFPFFASFMLQVFWWRRGDKFIFLDCSNFAPCRRLLYLFHFLSDKSCLFFLVHILSYFQTFYGSVKSNRQSICFQKISQEQWKMLKGHVKKRGGNIYINFARRQMFRVIKYS